MTITDYPTERRNPRTASIDTVSTAEMLQLMNDEDAHAVRAAGAAAQQLAKAVDAAHQRLSRGGAVHYFGAGASGRLALLDASEVTPTFGAPPELFTAHFPGGARAVADSSIDHEDAADLGTADAADLDTSSVAVGVTASGGTAYVGGALKAANSAGALTILLTCNPAASLRAAADISVVADTGAEALTGSTRLKAGTATKILLNSFSTALMIKSGRTYGNLMVGLVATNAKLRERAVAVLREATGEDATACRQALSDNGGEVPPALVCLLTGCTPERARAALAMHPGIRRAITAVREEGQ
ncbi:N-acetylmuramic acid 6-phosphate etherase [Phytoactinopolyspora alkaliphila]|uniref:N-acetylmuramic acid 6-phosphate etherase n=1 Tax=Phytoactinopolyspora alkaliphila TaxID=1783498 RepID=A0A6N9YML8_9ACTN|nr:N-acetylmuramic acid 6-phosphate etherase [Phytoactinopolyspora alkaliphila]NED96224.1 N-acetylmuramic acid 6-phosphate etherase [Phytoactinopolyspora alkaliphila]